MNAFVAAEPHRTTMARVDGGCEEATFVDWEEHQANLPSCQEAPERFVAEGQATALTNSAPVHHRPNFPAPVDSQ